MTVPDHIAAPSGPKIGPPPPWYARLILALQRRKYGSELESARQWARLLRALFALTLLYRSLDGRKSRIDAGEVLELTALVAFQNVSSKCNAALGVRPQGFCREHLQQ